MRRVKIASLNGHLEDSDVNPKTTAEPGVPPSEESQILRRLAEEGVVEWQGGKPKGLRGIVVRGEPVSETIIKYRR